MSAFNWQVEEGVHQVATPDRYMAEINRMGISVVIVARREYESNLIDEKVHVLPGEDWSASLSLWKTRVEKAIEQDRGRRDATKGTWPQPWSLPIQR